MNDKSPIDLNERIALARGVAFRKMREAKKLTQAALAEKVGTTQQTIDRLERGQVLNSRLIPHISKHLGFKDPNASLESLERQIESLSRQETESAISSAGAFGYELAVDPQAYLPVHALVPAGEGYVLSSDPVDHIPRTFPVHMAVGAYGVIVPDAEMVPVFRPGDIVIVNPNLPPMEGSDVLLIGSAGDVREAMVRSLESIGRKGWLATSWNPATQESFPRSEWKAEVIVARISRSR